MKVKRSENSEELRKEEESRIAVGLFLTLLEQRAGGNVENVEQLLGDYIDTKWRTDRDTFEHFRGHEFWRLFQALKGIKTSVGGLTAEGKDVYGRILEFLNDRYWRFYRDDSWTRLSRWCFILQELLPDEITNKKLEDRSDFGTSLANYFLKNPEKVTFESFLELVPIFEELGLDESRLVEPFFERSFKISFEDLLTAKDLAGLARLLVIIRDSDTILKTPEEWEDYQNWWEFFIFLIGRACKGEFTRFVLMQNVLGPLVEGAASSALSEEGDVRTDVIPIALARRENLPRVILQMLSLHGNPKVRSSLTRRNDLPIDVIQRLIYDDDPDVSIYMWFRDDLPAYIYSDKRAIYPLLKTWERLDPDGYSPELFADWCSAAARIPYEMIKELAGDDDPKIRRGVAYVWELPEEALMELARDDDVLVRCAVVERHDLSEALIQVLARDEHPWIQMTLARRGDVPQELLRETGGTYSTIIRKFERLFELRESGKLPRWAEEAQDVAGRNDLPEDFIRKLAYYESHKAREEIARRKDLPENLILKLAGDESMDVSWAIWSRKNLPEKIFNALHNDERALGMLFKMGAYDYTPPEGWLDLLKRVESPEDFLLRLASSEIYGWVVAQIPNLTGDIIRLLSFSGDIYVRQAIAGRADLPLDVIQRFVDDKDRYVRLTVAKHPKLPADLIEKLARSNDILILEVLLEREVLGEDLIREIAQRQELRKKLVELKILPDNFIRELSRIGDPIIRKRLTQRENLPQDVIRLLSDDGNLEVRKLIAKRGDLPGEMVQKLANDDHPEVREVVAKRVDLSKDLINTLAMDENKKVRDAIDEKVPELLRLFQCIEKDIKTFQELRKRDHYGATCNATVKEIKSPDPPRNEITIVLKVLEVSEFKRTEPYRGSPKGDRFRDALAVDETGSITLRLEGNDAWVVYPKDWVMVINSWIGGTYKSLFLAISGVRYNRGQIKHLVVGPPRWKCPRCDYIYDESKEGMKFAELDDDWCCPNNCTLLGFPITKESFIEW